MNKVFKLDNFSVEVSGDILFTGLCYDSEKFICSIMSSQSEFDCGMKGLNHLKTHRLNSSKYDHLPDTNALCLQ